MIAEADGYSDGGVYPDNLQIVSVFCDMMTQWRVGPAGATGLDYKALLGVFEIRGITEDKSEIFDGVKVMEYAALKEMRDK